MFKLYVISELKLTVSCGVYFQNVASWARWSVIWTPLFCQSGINHLVLAVDPDDCQVCPHEEHMDGSIYPAITFFHQDKAFF